MLEAAGEGTKGADRLSPIFRPRLSLFSDHLKTVLAVKGSLLRAQQRRALDGFRAVPDNHFSAEENAHSERPTPMSGSGLIDRSVRLNRLEGTPTGALGGDRLVLLLVSLP